MSTPSQKQIEEAFQILSRYERALIEKMAAEVIERREDFDSPFLGGAEALIDKYHHLLACLRRVRSGLYAYLPGDQRQRPLAKHEFRCFRCHSIIRVDDDSCAKCGWTWG